MTLFPQTLTRKDVIQRNDILMERRIKYTRKIGDVEESIEVEQSDNPLQKPIESTTSNYDYFKETLRYETSTHCAMICFLSDVAVFLMRQRFPYKRINAASFIFTMLFLGFSMLIFWERYSAGKGNENIGLPNSYLASTILFAFIVIVMLIKCYVFCNRKETLDKGYFDFLIKKNGNRVPVILFIEPLMFISFGAGWAFYNLYAGLIIVYSGIAIWGRALYEWEYLRGLILKQSESDQPKANNQLELIKQ